MMNDGSEGPSEMEAHMYSTVCSSNMPGLMGQKVVGNLLGLQMGG